MRATRHRTILPFSSNCTRIPFRQSDNWVRQRWHASGTTASRQNDRDAIRINQFTKCVAHHSTDHSHTHLFHLFANAQTVIYNKIIRKLRLRTAQLLNTWGASSYSCRCEIATVSTCQAFLITYYYYYFSFASPSQWAHFKLHLCHVFHRRAHSDIECHYDFVCIFHSQRMNLSMPCMAVRLRLRPGSGRRQEEAVHTVKLFGPKIECANFRKCIYLFQNAIKSLGTQSSPFTSVSTGKLWLRCRVTKTGNDGDGHGAKRFRVLLWLRLTVATTNTRCPKVNCLLIRNPMNRRWIRNYRSKNVNLINANAARNTNWTHASSEFWSRSGNISRKHGTSSSFITVSFCIRCRNAHTFSPR